ncbi:hypothetical protein Rsub_00900 [Raphidocelis subcapitata]|uniref:Uncharacterized protein n=1 Tax=Raphidocelis subcapitata TaxID=307507 RepID=A0A2V0NLB3_9CHLO|nr:hypothetical protein Rsub_00900 [Raphidocelis subcapitata]|eukprot:GBF88188.1 hypothetical protein Rsub_00900 [Raphidocelis subcapitata]
MRAAAPLLLLALLAAASARLAGADVVKEHRTAAPAAGANCRGERAVVTPSSMPNNVSAEAFSQAGVEQHFEAYTDLGEFVPSHGTTFACVDSRSEYGVLGTPGGDIAELIGAVIVYFAQSGEAFSEEAVAEAFNAFVSDEAGIITAKRPLYMHTSDDKLRSIFKKVYDDGVKPKPTTFPHIAPKGKKERDIWLKHLLEGGSQGCGHLRLMLERPADYGLPTVEVPRAVIAAYLNWWWPTPLGSPERAKARWTVLQGPLIGKAVCVVDSDEGCADASPTVPASHDGSQVFVYHAKAVQEFRDQVLVPWFVSYGASRGKTIDQARFSDALKSLQSQHLGATLKLLDPVNRLPLWAVTVKSKQI